MDGPWTELVKKIELQSVLVLAITLACGSWLLSGANNFNTPRGILGAVSIGFGLLYTFGSFFSNQIRESYKDVIAEYKSTISTLRSSSKDIQKHYQETLTGSRKAPSIGGYQSEASDEGTESV